MAFAENLKRLRQQKGLTQQKLGEMAGVSQQAILNFEKGKNNPNIVTGVNIAKALGVTCEELVEG